MAQGLAAEDGDVGPRGLRGVVPIEVREERIQHLRRDEATAGRVEGFLVAVGAGEVAAEARDEDELGGRERGLRGPRPERLGLEAGVLVGRLDEEAGLAQGRLWQRARERAAHREPSQGVGISGFDERGLSGERLDEEHLPGARDRGESRMDAPEPASYALRPSTVTDSTLTPPFS